MLSIREVAAHLNCSEKIVRKLIRMQQIEDAEARQAKRQARKIGLPAVVYTEKLTRIREGDVVAFQQR